MTWNGKKIVDIARAFLDTNGVEKHITAVTAQPESILKEQVTAFRQGYLDLAGDLNVCSKRGLAERFDATIGSGTVLMPFGGQYQLTAHSGDGQSNLHGRGEHRHLFPDVLGL